MQSIRSAYGTDPNQFGELRLPQGGPSHPGLYPVVLFIHGGFWRASFDLTHANPLCLALNAAGLATWSTEYRRIGQPGGGFPGTVEDVRHAALHLKTIAPRHQLDLTRLTVAGHSAGGHLALWLAAQNVIEMRKVVSLAGVSDLRRASELKLSNSVVDQFLNGAPFKQASPIEMLPISTPQVLLHGTADDIVPFEISERFAKASKNATLVPLPGAGHFLIDPTAKEWPLVLSHLS